VRKHLFLPAQQGDSHEMKIMPSPDQQSGIVKDDDGSTSPRVCMTNRIATGCLFFLR
jgi:hypothetical protein